MARFSSGAEFEIFETLDSTSLEAKRRAQTGDVGPRWFLARRQTAGYGRREREWLQDTGDLAATYLFRPEGPITEFGQLSFVAALALASAFDDYTPSDKVGLKWPNDVLLEGRKAAGILLELIEAGGAPALTIGIGVNIVSAPSGVAYPTTRLLDFTKNAPSPETLCERIDQHFSAFFEVWRRQGFAALRDLWVERAAGVGSQITVRLPDEELEGIFEGIDNSGGLILRSDAGKRIISAGDVFFSPPGKTQN